jgi:hypothetical protein
LNADPDLATQINADPCGSGSETLPEETRLNRVLVPVTVDLGYIHRKLSYKRKKFECVENYS